MDAPMERQRAERGTIFDVSCFTVGLALLTWCLVMLGRDGWPVPAVALLAVPLIAALARFPVVVDEGDGGIEIGFDSAVLMLLACTLTGPAALAVWSVGVVCTQLTSARRWRAKVFNIGVGIIAGGVATATVHVLRGPDPAGPRELAAVALAAAAYFAIDYAASAVSVALDSSTSLRTVLLQRGTWLAVAVFVPFDLLGYLGAVLTRTTPWWTLALLAVPLATLVIATRAISHGRENARRLQVLLDAAVDSQTLSQRSEVLDTLVKDAQRLLRLPGVVVRPEPPSDSEVGSQVRGGERAVWVVAPASSRARSTVHADQRALAALAAVAKAAFARLALTEDLVHLARYDPLTDLPNRAVFLDRLHYALHLARRRQHQVALLFVDLDGFKPINDRFGHAAGDAVLVDVARRLRAHVRDGDMVARLGGDEFAVLLEDIELDEVTEVCGRVLTAISRGVDTPDQQVAVSASIGISYGSGHEQADEMLRNADLAMYSAKSRGKNSLVVYDPGMLKNRLERLELLEALEDALRRDALTLVYQPVIVADTGQISGVEVLARWRHEGVNVPPDVFIKLAEETGLIGAVGTAVLDMARRDADAITRAADGEIKIAVNVSPTQLNDPAFIGQVRVTLAGMAGAGLVLEITEREGISQDEAVLDTMRRINEMGVTFAIDDFGVGFSSISYLQKVPALIVKIDATLSQHIDHDDQARGLLRSITMMAQSLGHDVVIEGVERESQLSLVREDVQGAFAQGYHMYRPMPLPELLVVLQENRRTIRVPARSSPALRV